MADLTPETIADLATPRDCDLSPDGQLIAYTLAPIGKQDEHPVSTIWVATTGADATARGPDEMAAPRRFTGGTADDRQPRWSPDGTELAFLSDRAERGTAQLYVLAVDGGEGRAVTGTKLKRPVRDFAWSPGGGHIAFTSADEPDAEDERREKERDDPTVFGERDRYARLRVVSHGTREVTTLVGGERHVTAIAWSPDGTQLAYVVQRTPDPESLDLGVAIERVSLGGGEPQTVCRFPTRAGDLIWASDGQTLLFTAAASRAPQSSSAVYAVPSAGGEPQRIALGEDSCAGGLQQPPGAAHAVVLEGRGLGARLCWLDPAGGALRQLVPVDTEDERFDLNAWRVRVVARGGDGPRRGRQRLRQRTGDTGEATVVVAAIRSAGDRPWEVWAGALPPVEGTGRRPAAASLRCLTRHQEALSGIAFGAQEPFTWKAPDGWKLDGLLIRPPAGRTAGAPAEEGPLPAVVLVHGGPYGRWGCGFQLGALNWAQWLALAGYAVLLPNPRGGSGHGERFAAAARGDVGGADYRDVMAAVDAAVERGVADPDRLAIGGWSQGGFMAAWAVTQTRRFRAAIMGAGISDWGMMTLTSDLPGFERVLGGSVPWDGVGPHRHAQLSPISFARAVTTPVLLLHGERDERVPVSQAIGFHRALREVGVPTALVVYPREPHGIGERAHQIDLLRRVRSWCDRWLRS